MCNINRQNYNTSLLRNDIMLSSLSEPASPRFSSTFNEFVNSTTTYNSSGRSVDLHYNNNNNYIVINSSLSAPQSPHPFSRANGGFQSYNNDTNTMSTLLSNHIHKALASSSTSSSSKDQLYRSSTDMPHNNAYHEGACGTNHIHQHNVRIMRRSSRWKSLATLKGMLRQLGRSNSYYSSSSGNDGPRSSVSHNINKSTNILGPKSISSSSTLSSSGLIDPKYSPHIHDHYTKKSVPYHNNKLVSNGTKARSHHQRDEDMTMRKRGSSKVSGTTFESWRPYRLNVLGFSSIRSSYRYMSTVCKNLQSRG